MKSSSLYVDRSTNQLVTEGASNDRGLLFSPDLKKKKTRGVSPKEREITQKILVP